MNPIKTVFNLEPTESDLDISNFNYQKDLTIELDKQTSDFNQETINEIVLWKVNRYVKINDATLELINRIKATDKVVNQELTGAIFLELLSKEQKGVRLPMASSILRFKNPKIYQIIDQRVYRFIYGRVLEYSLLDINQQICIYLDYLDKLKEVCELHNIEFEIADRILYCMDKKYNSGLNLNGYSTNKNS